jgi:hypothetical protein
VVIDFSSSVGLLSATILGKEFRVPCGRKRKKKKIATHKRKKKLRKNRHKKRIR